MFEEYLSTDVAMGFAIVAMIITVVILLAYRKKSKKSNIAIATLSASNEELQVALKEYENSYDISKLKYNSSIADYKAAVQAQIAIATDLKNNLNVSKQLLEEAHQNLNACKSKVNTCKHELNARSQFPKALTQTIADNNIARNDAISTYIRETACKNSSNPTKCFNDTSLHYVTYLSNQSVDTVVDAYIAKYVAEVGSNDVKYIKDMFKALKMMYNGLDKEADKYFSNILQQFDAIPTTVFDVGIKQVCDMVRTESQKKKMRTARDLSMQLLGYNDMSDYTSSPIFKPTGFNADPNAQVSYARPTMLTNLLNGQGQIVVQVIENMLDMIIRSLNKFCASTDQSKARVRDILVKTIAIAKTEYRRLKNRGVMQAGGVITAAHQIAYL